MIKHTEVTYGNQFKGDLFLPEGDESHPCIILFHTWMGKDGFMRQKAEELVGTLGIATFCADLYGDGKSTSNSEEAAAWMTPLFFDRAELRKRVLLAFEAAGAQPLVKKESIGAIGFCFGGLAAIELFRSGSPVKGVVAFHPVLGDSRDGAKAKIIPMASEIKGSLLVLHGFLDPLVSREDIVNFQNEMNEAKVDWQMNTYGKAYHAFTNPNVNDPKSGMVFNPQTNTRAFNAMSNFLMSLL